MARYQVSAATDDALLTSTASTISVANSGVGSTKTVNTTASTAAFGQNFSGGNYSVIEYLCNFDTSAIASNETVVAAALSFVQTTRSGNVTPYAVQHTWTTPATTAQWTAAPFGNGTDAYTGYFDAQTITSEGFLTSINKGGASRYLMCTAQGAVISVPTSANTITIDTAESGSGPKLTVYTVPRSTMRLVSKASRQLSTGDTVVVLSDGGTTPALSLGYYAKGTTTFTSISSLTGWDVISGQETMQIVIDSSDNLYVVGKDGTSNFKIRAQGFNKSTGLTWVAQTAATQALANTSSGIQCLVADWSNTLGPGHIFVVANHNMDTRQGVAPNIQTTTDWATLNCGTLQTGSGVLFTANGTSPTWLQADTYDGIVHMDMTPLVPGGLVYGLTLGYNIGASVSQTTVVTLSSVGAISNGTTARTLNLSTNQLTAETRVIALPVSASQWFVVMPGTNSGGVIVQSIDNTNVGGTSYVSAQLSTMPTFYNSGNWSALYDSAIGNVWLYYIDATTPRRLARIPFAIATHTWTSTETQVTAALGSSGTTNTFLRGGPRVANDIYVTLDVSNLNGSTYSTVAVNDSFNVAPNAPILTTKANFDATTSANFAWTFSDPNPHDSQTKYALEIDNTSSGLSAYRSGVVTSSANNLTLAASALAQNQPYRWRVDTYDILGVVGPFSSYGTFATNSIGFVTITDPVADNPAGFNVSSYLVKWSYTTTGTATQAKYQITVTDASTAAVYYDSGLVTSATMQATVSSIPSGVAVLINLYLINTLSQTTATVSRALTSSYAAPDAPVINSVTVDSVDDSVITVNYTIATPTGSRPLPTSVGIYRDGVLVGSQTVPFAGAFSYSDPLAFYGTTPVYEVVAVAATGSTPSSDVALAGPLMFNGARIAYLSNGSWFNDTAVFFGGPNVTDTLSVSATSLQFAGRSFPVTEFGESQSQSIACAYTVAVDGNPYLSLNGPLDGIETNHRGSTVLNDLRGVVTGRLTVCLRDSRGRRNFGTITDLSIKDDTTATYAVSFTLNVVDYTEGS